MSWTRPDGRTFVFSAEDVAESSCDLYVTLDEADDARRCAFERLGFVTNRRESVFLIPVCPVHAQPPAGFVFAGADEVEEDRLRELDDALRQDVPGTDGWRWDGPAFREETYDSAAFDPATYLVAAEQASGKYVGLVRVWNNPTGPRLGMIGVLPPYRRRGLAKALLAGVFRVLHKRGEAAVSTEIDETNVASLALIQGLGARRTGGFVELIRRRDTVAVRDGATPQRPYGL